MLNFVDDFVFEEQSLVYDNGPLMGFLRRNDGARFAFFCDTVIDGKLYHWSLIPAQTGDDPMQVARHALTGQPALWISVIEDRREEPRYSAVVMTTSETPPRFDAGPR